MKASQMPSSRDGNSSSMFILMNFSFTVYIYLFLNKYGGSQPWLHIRIIWRALKQPVLVPWRGINSKPCRETDIFKSSWWALINMQVGLRTTGLRTHLTYISLIYVQHPFLTASHNFLLGHYLSWFSLLLNTLNAIFQVLHICS